MNHLYPLLTEDFYRALFEVLPVGLCITDEEGKFVFTNQSYLQIYGYKAEELLGESFLKVVLQKDQAHLSKVHQDFIRQGHEEIKHQWEVIGKQGNLIHILAVANRFQGRDGRYYKITMVTDVTQKTVLKKQKDLSDRVLFHDLKSQIQEIENLTQTILPQNSTPRTPLESFAENILKTTNQLRVTLMNTMDLHLIEEGHYTLVKGDFSLNELFECFKNQFAERFNRAEVNFSYLILPSNTSDGLDWVFHSNEILLKGILENLILNALEASPPGKTVKIVGQFGQDPYILISNESEIPVEIRDKFFQPYITSKVKGTGLGTYSAFLLTQALGGKLTFETGGGMTTLKLLLPPDILREQKLTER